MSTVRLPGAGSRRVIEPGGPFRFDGEVPGDKSISHRAALLALLADGESVLEHYAPGADCLSSLGAVRALGAEVEYDPASGTARVRSTGTVREPSDVIDAGNSGTLARFLMGILSGAGVYAVVTGDDSLRTRPMGRVLAPLESLGARFAGRMGGDRLPVAVLAGRIRSGTVQLSVASAQVKSALLLAGLFADGPTTVLEPLPSRDHTERMLRSLGVSVQTRADGSGRQVMVTGPARPGPVRMHIPGDPSSAAFLFGAAVISGGSVTVRGLGLNGTRVAFLDVLREMGATVTVEDVHEEAGEPAGDVTVGAVAALKAVRIEGERIPAMIDELPLLSAVAARAEGRTEIHGAKELRIKETDRITATVDALRTLGAQAGEYEDGLWVEGTGRLRGGEVEARGDHRIAMAFGVLGRSCDDPVTVIGAGAADVSFPGFWELVAQGPASMR